MAVACATMPCMPMAVAYVDVQVITACVLEGLCMAVALLAVPVSGCCFATVHVCEYCCFLCSVSLLVVTPLSPCLCLALRHPLPPPFLQIWLLRLPNFASSPPTWSTPGPPQMFGHISGDSRVCLSLSLCPQAECHRRWMARPIRAVSARPLGVRVQQAASTSNQRPTPPTPPRT